MRRNVWRLQRRWPTGGATLPSRHRRWAPASHGAAGPPAHLPTARPLCRRGARGRAHQRRGGNVQPFQPGAARGVRAPCSPAARALGEAPACTVFTWLPLEGAHAMARPPARPDHLPAAHAPCSRWPTPTLRRVSTACTTGTWRAGAPSCQAALPLLLCASARCWRLLPWLPLQPAARTQPSLLFAHLNRLPRCPLPAPQPQQNLRAPPLNV